MFKKFAIAAPLAFLALNASTAFAAGEANHTVNIKANIPTTVFHAQPRDPNFGRDETLTYNIVSGELAPLSAIYDLKNTSGSVHAYIEGGPAVLFNGNVAQNIPLTTTLHGVELTGTPKEVVNEADSTRAWELNCASWQPSLRPPSVVPTPPLWRWCSMRCRQRQHLNGVGARRAFLPAGICVRAGRFSPLVGLFFIKSPGPQRVPFMFPMTPIAVALALVICTSTLAAPTPGTVTPGSLLTQAQGLPAGFGDHFFDVPLAVQVELDQQTPGGSLDCAVQDERVTLLEFTDTGDGEFPRHHPRHLASLAGERRRPWRMHPGVPAATGVSALQPGKLTAVDHHPERRTHQRRTAFSRAARRR